MHIDLHGCWCLASSGSVLRCVLIMSLRQWCYSWVLMKLIPSGHDGAGQMQHFVTNDGFNTFRLPVGWQFLTNDVEGSTLNSTNFAKYDALVQV